MISNQPVLDFWIYHCECNQSGRKCVLAGVLIVNGPTRSTHTMTQGSDSAILGGSSPYFLLASSFLVI
jgi:hypothetical protein